MFLLLLFFYLYSHFFYYYYLVLEAIYYFNKYKKKIMSSQVSYLFELKQRVRQPKAGLHDFCYYSRWGLPP